MDEKINVITANETSQPNTTVSPVVDPPVNEAPKQFLNKKIIFIVLGLIVLGEVIWAGMTLMQSSPASTTDTQTSQPAADSAIPPTTIELSSPVSQIKVGENLKVSINIQSDQSTAGTDLIISYDPAYLTPQPQNSNVVVLESLYNNYPVNTFDEKLGKITVSGVSSNQGGTVPNGLFGTINFKAKTAGNTQVKIDFQENSSKDTNVILSGQGKDILTGVTNLDLQILP